MHYVKRSENFHCAGPRCCVLLSAPRKLTKRVDSAAPPAVTPNMRSVTHTGVALNGRRTPAAHFRKTLWDVGEDEVGLVGRWGKGGKRARHMQWES
jgi:hypothetical protein